ncbi:MAG: DsbA family protein [Chloroflexi bacterium]|nr:DsbA family protein [Chloroflexota bacterium]MCI0578376.1 DsbA family protein [Chloroflexota bacterium]MCI0645392.1 DsbA family protein [Chloroflexota bacterium]MCI0732159.1 DsbA family protein [Chloroflexota bacterium]
MLGTEPEIVESYVNGGQVRLVFWPVLDHGNASLDSHAAADCIGRQSADAFWQIHDQFFANQNELWQADREYYVNAAVAVGVDQAAFEECYDGGTGHATVTELDSIRRERGIFNRPTFDVNGQLFFGAQPFETFAQFIEAALTQ